MRPSDVSASLPAQCTSTHLHTPSITFTISRNIVFHLLGNLASAVVSQPLTSDPRRSLPLAARMHPLRRHLSERTLAAAVRCVKTFTRAHRAPAQPQKQLTNFGSVGVCEWRWLCGRVSVQPSDDSLRHRRRLAPFECRGDVFSTRCLLFCDPSSIGAL